MLEDPTRDRVIRVGSLGSLPDDQSQRNVFGEWSQTEFKNLMDFVAKPAQLDVFLTSKASTSIKNRDLGLDIILLRKRDPARRLLTGEIGRERVCLDHACGKTSMDKLGSNLGLLGHAHDRFEGGNVVLALALGPGPGPSISCFESDLNRYPTKLGLETGLSIEVHPDPYNS